ncbi:MAG TPA: serine/threonine-protein kinase [Labilithrix sp.]|jgi:serine/threonine protein kinase
MLEEVPAAIGGYRVVRELGRGGMGAVFEVRDPNELPFALKVMTESSPERPDLVERLRREARAAEMIASDHVVRVFSMGFADELRGAPFLVMELLDGATVATHLAKHGPMMPERVCAIVSHVGHALDRAHAVGIVHRDLKPENLFIHRNEHGHEIVKVLDFGVARLLDDDATAITATGATIGSLHYMPPEQTDSQKNAIGPQADVWAMGMIALELLTGERYWGKAKPTAIIDTLMAGNWPPPRAKWPRLPPAIDAWFARSCARQPAARFASIGEQAAALAQVLRQ